MPTQERRRHLPVSRHNMPDEQERSQRHSYLEKDVLGVLNWQTTTCAASCTAAESSPATAAERFRWPRLSRLADSNRAPSRRLQSGEAIPGTGPIGLERPGSSKTLHLMRRSPTVHDETVATQGGTTSGAIGKLFPYLHCVRNESRLNTDGSCVSDQYDPTIHALAAASAPKSYASYAATAKTRTIHCCAMPAMPAAVASRSVRTRSTRPSTTRRSSRPAPSTSRLRG
jgi:hypothetical protein